MFYRVDYIISVLLVGLLTGFLFGRTSTIVPSRQVAFKFYVVTAILLVLRSGLFVGTILTARQSYTLFGGLTGGIAGLIFGAIFGLAIRRGDALSC
jgi:hypothetical protein